MDSAHFKIQFSKDGHPGIWVETTDSFDHRLAVYTAIVENKDPDSIAIKNVFRKFLPHPGGLILDKIQSGGPGKIEVSWKANVNPPPTIIPWKIMSICLLLYLFRI